MASTNIVAFTHLLKSPAKSKISIWSLSSQSKGVYALLFKLHYIVRCAYAFKNQGHKNFKLPVTKLHDLSRVLFERTWQQQGVTLALARLPRRVSKVSGERKSSITRPFGEYDFNCQEII